MIDYLRTMVPLESAHELLAAFGIGPHDRSYRRWATDAGFRLVDFIDVLVGSSLVITVDWRAWLSDEIDVICEQLSRFSIELNVDLSDEGTEGVVEFKGQRTNIKYVPTDSDDFDGVMRAINRLIHPTVRYRKFRSCDGTDGWTYAVQPNDVWDALELRLPDLIDLLFFPRG